MNTTWSISFLRCRRITLRVSLICLQSKKKSRSWRLARVTRRDFVQNNDSTQSECALSLFSWEIHSCVLSFLVKFQVLRTYLLIKSKLWTVSGSPTRYPLIFMESWNIKKCRLPKSKTSNLLSIIFNLIWAIVDSFLHLRSQESAGKSQTLECRIIEQQSTNVLLPWRLKQIITPMFVKH